MLNPGKTSAQLQNRPGRGLKKLVHYAKILLAFALLRGGELRTIRCLRKLSEEGVPRGGEKPRQIKNLRVYFEGAKAIWQENGTC